MNQEVKILGVVGVATILLIFGAIFFLGSGSNTVQNKPADQNLLVRQDSNKISTSSAKVTVVEFYDYQCPACGAAHPVVKQVIDQFKDKINFVFRNFAFIGQESTWAGEASECAAEQGKFIEYHNYLFEHQNGENKGAFSKDNLKNFAKSFELNTEQFNLCLDTEKYSEKVSNDRADGSQLGVNSTPTFFISKSLKGSLINGEKNVGVLNFEQFKQKIESKL